MKSTFPKIFALHTFAFISLIVSILTKERRESGVSTDQYLIKDFRTSFLTGGKKEGYYPVELGIAGDETVIGYADVNNDKYLDLITYKKEDNTIKFFFNKYDHGSSKFVKDTNMLFSLYGNYTITNLFANVLYPGSPLAFIVSATETESGKPYSFVYWPEKDAYVLKTTFNDTNIIIGDIDGDRRIEVLYFKDEKRKVAFFDSEGNSDSKDFELFLYGEGNCSVEKNRFLGKPFGDGGSAIVDITSDCKNDLLITSKEGDKTILEIYKGLDVNTETKYCLYSSFVIELNNTFGPFSIGDFNGDGYVDLIFPYKNSNKIVVAYNKHRPKYDWSSKYCPNHLIDINNNAPIFDLSNIQKEADYVKGTEPDAIEFELKSSNEEGTYPFYAPDTITNTLLRVGDFKTDALPGLLLIQKNSANDTKYVRLYRNRYKDKKDGRSDNFWDFEDEFTNLTNPLYASFFDFDESGQLSILIMGSHDKENCTIGYFNNYFPDTYFIKGKTMLEKDKFYTTEIGTNYRYIVTNNDGTRRMDVAFQLSQTMDLSLNLPYALVGIGRSNNYIENFNVISNSNDYQKIKTKSDNKPDNYTFTPIIPKSQMLINKNLNKKDEKYSVEWTIELIVNPTDMIFVLIIVIAAILVVILIVIIILHVKEVKEDKQQESEKFTAWFA